MAVAILIGSALYAKSQNIPIASRAVEQGIDIERQGQIAQEYADSASGVAIASAQQEAGPEQAMAPHDKVDNKESQESAKDERVQASAYPLHKNITTTFFWAGEEAGEDNKNISNLPSAWDEQWVRHFGGVDNPDKRSGFFPANFTPKENPFYFALPYNDFDEDGNRKQEVSKIIPWVKGKKIGENESVLKNRWIRIIKNGKEAYAQWQDVGPFKEDDAAYVFGTALPKSKINNNAGLDVSPAVRDYLKLADIDAVDWQFVDESQVPEGPWHQVVTTSQIYWQ